MSNEDFQARLRRQAIEAGEISHLEAGYGNHPVLPHIATVATALAVMYLEIGVDRKNNLRVRAARKPMANLPVARNIAKGKRNYGFSGKSGYGAPYIHATVSTASVNNSLSPYFSQLPTGLSRAVLNSDRWVISASKLELSYPPSQNWQRGLSVGVTAVHYGSSEEKTRFEKSANVTEESDFDDLFAMIYDTEEVEDGELETYMGTQKTMTTVETLTGDPERHFNMHEAMGLTLEHIAMARSTFNAVAQVAGIPYSVATDTK